MGTKHAEFSKDFQDWIKESNEKIDTYLNTPKRPNLTEIFRQSLIGSIEDEYIVYYKIVNVLCNTTTKENKKRWKIMKSIIQHKKKQLIKRMIDLKLLIEDEDLNNYRRQFHKYRSLILDSNLINI